jgi:hypothetical protein
MLRDMRLMVARLVGINMQSLWSADNFSWKVDTSDGIGAAGNMFSLSRKTSSAEVSSASRESPPAEMAGKVDGDIPSCTAGSRHDGVASVVRQRNVIASQTFSRTGGKRHRAVVSTVIVDCDRGDVKHHSALGHGGDI